MIIDIMIYVQSYVDVNNVQTIVQQLLINLLFYLLIFICIGVFTGMANMNFELMIIT